MHIIRIYLHTRPGKTDHTDAAHAGTTRRCGKNESRRLTGTGSTHLHDRSPVETGSSVAVDRQGPGDRRQWIGRSHRNHTRNGENDLIHPRTGIGISDCLIQTARTTGIQVADDVLMPDAHQHHVVSGTSGIGNPPHRTARKELLLLLQ